MVEAWVEVINHVGNEEETSERASNDAVDASLGRSVGGHARLGASESENGSDRKSMSASGARRGRRRKTRMTTVGQRDKAGMAAVANDSHEWST